MTSRSASPTSFPGHSSGLVQSTHVQWKKTAEILCVSRPTQHLFFFLFKSLIRRPRHAASVQQIIRIWCVMTCGRAWLRGPEWGGCPCETCTYCNRPPGKDYFLSHMHARMRRKQAASARFPHARRACARMHSHIFFFHSTLLFNPPSSIGFWFPFPYLWSNWPVEMELLVVLPCCYIRI